MSGCTAWHCAARTLDESVEGRLARCDKTAVCPGVWGLVLFVGTSMTLSLSTTTRSSVGLSVRGKHSPAIENLEIPPGLQGDGSKHGIYAF